MTPDKITTYMAALTALVTAITTLVLTIRNAIKTNEIHAMVKADASPEALVAAKPAPPAPEAPKDAPKP